MESGKGEELPRSPGRGKGRVLAMLAAKPRLRVAPVPHRRAAVRPCPVQPAAMRRVGLRKGDRTMSAAEQKIHPHATGLAAKTVEAHQQPQDLVFYSGWVCILIIE